MVILFFSVVRYLLLAGIFYIICYAPGLKSLQRFKIQHRNPRRTQIVNELRYSISTVIIFSLMGLIVFELYCNDLTTIYLNPNKYGVSYLMISLIGLILVHDCYFYWTHRLLHTKWLFRRVHKIHHLSINPTPWAAYSFHPIEALLQSIIILPMVTIFPVHIGVFLLFTFIVLIMNVLGHLGYEFYPSHFKKSLPGRWLTSSTHHNLHHQHGSKNFGYYFTFWDVLMVTLKNDARN